MRADSSVVLFDPHAAKRVGSKPAIFPQLGSKSRGETLKIQTCSVSLQSQAHNLVIARIQTCSVSLQSRGYEPVIRGASFVKKSVNAYLRARIRALNVGAVNLLCYHDQPQNNALQHATGIIGG